MRILLYFPQTTLTGVQTPDIGLGYVAAGLRRHGHSVAVYQSKEIKTYQAFRKKIQEFKPDVLGLKVFSLALKIVRQVIEVAREERPDLTVVLGGPHVSIAPPEDTMRFFPSADYGFQGEAELAFPRFIDKLEQSEDVSDSPGLIYRKNGVVRANPPLVHLNLDDYDDPAWDLIDPREYDGRWYIWTQEHPAAPILTSRGCPYRCTFCAQNVVQGKIVRRRSLERVINEMELLHNQYGVNDFDFLDDNFLMDPEYVRRFCESILAKKWKIRWNCCGARLDFLDLELVKLMDRAGCNYISVGFESGSKRILEYMKKDLDLDMVRVKSKMIAENTKIKLHGMFILGYPTETVEDIRKTIRLALALPLTIATFNTYIIMLGCEEFDRLKASGEIASLPWDKVSIDEHAYSPRGIPYTKLKHLYWEAYLRFYFRPRAMWKVAGVILSAWRQIPVLTTKTIRLLVWRGI